MPPTPATCSSACSKKAADLGYTYYVGPELEFFLFANSSEPKILDFGGYFDAPPLDLGNDVRRDINFALESMGVAVEYSHHEVAPSQHEIDLRNQEALVMADYAMTYRVVVKEIARKHGCYATFMPKPLFGENGSGMHCHQSLFRGSKNAFYDAGDVYHLSREAKSYIAGLLRHAPEFTLIANQWVNSYKRLVPGYEAPVYIAWARRNRSSLVRGPMYKPGKEAATRIELRSPDPACNLYLCFAAMLGAGLRGIEAGYELVEPIEENIFKMTDDEMKAKGIFSLPGSLREAVDNLDGSELMREILGDHLHAALVENKKAEWDAYGPRSRNGRSNAICRSCTPPANRRPPSGGLFCGARQARDDNPAILKQRNSHICHFNLANQGKICQMHPCFLN